MGHRLTIGGFAKWAPREVMHLPLPRIKAPDHSISMQSRQCLERDEHMSREID